MVWRAAAAIDAGSCRTVLCVTGEAADGGVLTTRGGAFDAALAEFETPYGPMGGQLRLRLIAQYGIRTYGTTSRQLARSPSTSAPTPAPTLTPLRAPSQWTTCCLPLIVDPLHLPEIVLPCTGGAALVVTAVDGDGNSRR
jgi:hypothetical protein